MAAGVQKALQACQIIKAKPAPGYGVRKRNGFAEDQVYDAQPETRLLLPSDPASSTWMLLTPLLAGPSALQLMAAKAVERAAQCQRHILCNCRVSSKVTVQKEIQGSHFAGCGRQYDFQQNSGVQQPIVKGCSSGNKQANREPGPKRCCTCSLQGGAQLERGAAVKCQLLCL